MLIDIQREGAAEPDLSSSKACSEPAEGGLAFEAWDTPTPTAPAAVLLVRRAPAHVQKNIAGRPLTTGKERDAETGEANGNDYFGATKLARQTPREEPSKRLGGTGERGWAD